MSATTTPVLPRTPEACIAEIGRLLNAGDVAALMAHYEPGAVFVPSPGVVCATPETIAASMAEFIAYRPVLRTEVTAVHQSGDIALVLVDWSMRGTAPDGSAVEQGGRSTDVLRRQADGTWRVLIDRP